MGQMGAQTTIKHHDDLDHLPFGEEVLPTLAAGTTQGYSGNTVRQKFTSKECDREPASTTSG
ncbi:MAG TPA: hypothetical protein VGN90_14650 [Pyrinomonadaceae bacterium]|jgi:hypothetical protein|nr:hypothetical protein [Pyrinomonadaceae bacterium]